MTSSISSTSSTSTAQLNSTFTAIVNAQMTQESQPLTNLQTRLDDVKIKSAVYSDLNTQLSSLQDVAQSMISTDPFYDFDQNRTVSFSSTYKTSTGTAWEGDIATATASSTAAPATYTMVVSSVAKEQRVYSTKQTSDTDPLNLAGTFLLGGAADRSAVLSTPIASTLTAAGTTTLDTGQEELKTGTYTVETKYSEASGWMFRLVDADGNAVSIQRTDETGYTSNWQVMPTGNGTDPISYDTGRGLTLTLGANSANYAAGEAQIDYTAKGASITVEADDTLSDIVNTINKGTYAEGMGVTATIVDHQLVLIAESTGVDNGIVSSYTSGTDVLQSLGIKDGTGYLNVMQEASDAVFTLNGIEVSRSSNDALTDVIQGVTLNISADAEGKTTTININADQTSQTDTIDDFISKFNKLQEYLSAKTGVTEQDDGTYQRGALAGDSMISSLKTALYRNVYSSDSSLGTFKSLADIGIELNDDMKLEITDEDALKRALGANLTSVQMLFDKMMGKMDDTLSKFTGKKSYVKQAMEASENEEEDLNDQIESMEDRLSSREEYLTNYYAQVQAELESLSSTMSTLTAMYG